MDILDFKQLLCSRVLVLDGAMGTMIQRFSFCESDFRGERFAAHNEKLAGCNDLLCIIRPDAIKSIHKAYLESGADIISSNSFNANSVSMQDYGLHRYPGLIREINRRAAILAREAADEAPVKDWGGKALVAGSIGPTNRTASMSPDVSDPAGRNVDYDSLFEAYCEQVGGLLEGGVDLLLFETVFDTLNLKAGLDAADRVMEAMGKTVPVMVSATMSDKAGRTLSGQTLGAFLTSIEGYDNVVTVGLNCSLGPVEMLPLLKELGGLTEKFVTAHPNAGLPNELGEYDVTPEGFAESLVAIIKEGLVNIAGGCCGTTPEHISALRDKLSVSVPHMPKKLREALRISGLERVEVLPENNFLNIGERCNVAGSRKFLRLIKEKKYEEAVEIAARQVEDGAMVIDINMDDAMLDAGAEMVHFLRYIASDPDISKVPVMIDSSNWDVVESALKNIQGKGIVNSISLKEGEELFLKKARRIRELGAAVIVMAFDEKGQADTFERKIEICRRAYRLLIEKCGYDRNDIIFDVNVMAVATGIEEHNRYALDFIRAVEWIKKNLPGARTSGGISNLSFAFRGKNTLREAMHAVFLYHAIRAGLDMGILNAAASVTYEDIDPALRNLLEDVILARRKEAADELAAYAMKESETVTIADARSGRDTSLPVEQRLKESIIKGRAEHLAEDLDEAFMKLGSAVKIIEGPLMAGMNCVGDLFGEGKMFLPQVVKTARTMKQAVDYLKPKMEEAGLGTDGIKSGKVLFATVKGDVHDIGKNIVSIVLACNNYEVIDLGVMVPAEDIVAAALEEHPDFVCLSGLITPSLSEMVNVAKAMNDAGLDIPLLVGGATTSKLHTALKIAPVYRGPVVHMTDAAQNPIVASILQNSSERADYLESLNREYSRIRSEYEGSKAEIVPISKARENGMKNRSGHEGSVRPDVALNVPVEIDIDLKEIKRFINWKMFFHSWKLSGKYIENFPYDGCDGCVEMWRKGLDSEERNKGDEALKLYKDANSLIAEIIRSGNFDGKGIVAFYGSYSKDDDIVIGETVIPLLRQQRAGSEHRSLSDYLASQGSDEYAGVFAVTAGRYVQEKSAQFKEAGDSYNSLLCQSLADRIAEASSEWLHMLVRRELWGYAPDESLSVADILKGKYSGIRPAIGYPMLPDQLLNNVLEELLPLERIGVSLTENGAMIPSSTVSGIYISNPTASYFVIGEIGDDQLKDYASRRGIGESRIREVMRL
ncbi:MAG: methionine synthase [Muribaculaceae bacterium]